MKDGYPEKHELEYIRKWDGYDIIECVSFIQSRGTYGGKYCESNWIKDFVWWRLRFILITTGWSGNEDIIEALLSNDRFQFWYYQWTRGGKHEFRIDPVNIGYMLVSEYCKENSISRQAINKSKHFYDFIKVSPHIIFVRKKTQ